ncbi:hypothetical protein PV04_07028 [Phialophora macrospora]|uniref:Dol-P-Man:Man(5)GlcNAc(2)-PP-Dol alpha-1,3-mannosyltransferase n=1 Tax=Phialophora macrospora TaxID=1851006 RepID=A0A0D2CRL8_9EURO|nr:hypothetical protein PV04_07028 [Phialophora macrospora]
MTEQATTLLTRVGILLYEVANGKHAMSWLIPVALFTADTALCTLIIWKVPYTEIDWASYMAQVAQIVSGERDYTNITGATGPLVYPAAHVYTYIGLYHLTDKGQDIHLAQILFAALYLLTLGVVMGCYWRIGVPPYVFPMLVLSKRLHSIFVLRCFNDCFATFFLWLSIFLLQRGAWRCGILAYSWGLGIKMTLLPTLPAVAVLVFLARGFHSGVSLALSILLLQIFIMLPFARCNPWGYLSRSFDLSRQFLFKWTVNWRFVGEAVFLSREFSILLLSLHLAVLLVFIGTRWLRPTRKSLVEIIGPMLQGRDPLPPGAARRVAGMVTPQHLLTMILSANIIGLLFARSLHYQFYAYLAWSTPYLLWQSRIHPLIQYSLWLAQELAWNVYPSTVGSSATVVTVLATTVACVWWRTKTIWVPGNDRAKGE